MKSLEPGGIDELILASGSPRRIQLLTQFGLKLQVEPADIDESVFYGESASELVSRLSRGKAESRWSQGRTLPVLAADTVVSVNSEILGKPLGPEDARRMLRLLSGRWHLVTSGVCVISMLVGCEVRVCETEVKMVEISESQIDWYLSSGEPFGKAGSYAIQGVGGVFVEQVRGNMHNVIGLPLPTAIELLENAGIDVLAVNHNGAEAL